MTTRPTYPESKLVLENVTHSPLKNAHVAATVDRQGGLDDSNQQHCKVCGVVLDGYRSDAKYCSNRCSQRAKRQRQSTIAKRTCEHCGKPFMPGHASQVYCRTACNNASYRQRRDAILPVFANIAGIDVWTADDLYERVGMRMMRKVVEAAGYRWQNQAWEKV